MQNRRQVKSVLKDTAPQKSRGLVNRINVNTNIEKDILNRAKEVAKENKIPLSRLLDEALRNQLAIMDAERTEEQMELTV